MSTAIANQNTTNSLRPPIQDDEAVKSVAESYGKYFSFNDLTQQQMNVVEDTIESMLIRLDELGALFNSGANTKKTLEVLPALKVQTKYLTKAFETIDKLEGLVNSFKRTADVMEQKMAVEEDKYSKISLNKIFNVFNSVADTVIPKQATGVKKEDLSIAPIEIPNTKQFFVDLRAAQIK
eukprot:TRINITY_DN7043_c0_g1_i1.p1 TRINITY_DN7043_c0_g1~~TRINITY_DN7043_c0_g1_i1.p1  ORF type:complete len:192 (+),score=42.46 TRINITY_DN7043_c0_g1_i1:37-576(+)